MMAAISEATRMPTLAWFSKGEAPKARLLMNSAIANMIRKNETNKIPSTIQTSKRFGMVTLDDYLYDLVMRDVITRETALDAAQDRRDLEARL